METQPETPLMCRHGYSLVALCGVCNGSYEWCICGLQHREHPGLDAICPHSFGVKWEVEDWDVPLGQPAPIYRVVYDGHFKRSESFNESFPYEEKAHQ